MLVRNLTLRLLVILCCAPVFCFAQLTTKQKTADFQQLVTYFEAQYAPAEWKKQVFGFDLFDTKPWLDRVAKSKDDLEFYEICAEYVASLNDTHSEYQMPSGWSASLGFNVDSYEGVILIDRIDRTRLPVDQFPFQIGDELVSVDGVGVESWIQRLSKWVAASNPQYKRAIAARWIVERAQASPEGSYPRAPMETSDSAVVKIRRQTGAIETYAIKWRKIGLAVLTVKPLSDKEVFKKKAEPNPFPLRAYSRPTGPEPLFVMPPGFEQRLRTPFLNTGVFSSAGLRIGYLRIPGFPAPDPSVNAQFASEIAYFNANTDGLVVDIMHNGGGAAASVLSFYSYLSPQPFYAMQAVSRASLTTLKNIAQELGGAFFVGDEEGIAFIQKKLQQAQEAYERGDFLTQPFPLIGTTALQEPAKDPQGNVIAYTKPIMLLTDTVTISAADAFAATFQDNQRGIIFGTRTNGAGGNIAFFSGGYSQGQAGSEINLNVRNHVVNVPGYPPTTYFDSIGVHPDIVADIMTKENLLNGGASFSQAMVAAITNYIQQQNQK